MDRSEFLRRLKEHFPELKPVVNKQEGLLHFEMEAFGNYAQRAIYDGDKQRLKKCFEFAREVYVQGDADLQKAIDISFVERLEFKTPQHTHGWAWGMLPDILKPLYPFPAPE